MKQYTTSEQTAKLIELGFERPEGIEEFLEPENDWSIGGLKQRKAYSIGELIEMLPMTIADEIWWGKEKGEDGIWGLRIGTEGTDYSWVISYERDNSAYLYREGRSELIDALYDMVVNLKREGLI